MRLVLWINSFLTLGVIVALRLSSAATTNDLVALVAQYDGGD